MPTPPIRPPAPGAGPIDPAELREFLKGRPAVVARQEGRKPPITRVLPVARVLLLGGEPRAAIELQLRDVAELQAWLEGAVPHPLAGLPPAWSDPEPATRRARLLVAWEAAKTWPVRFGSPEGTELMASDAGQTVFLATCLRKLDPSFSAADAVALFPRVTPAEWAGLSRVAYGKLPWMDLMAELEGPDDEPSRLTDWCHAFDLINTHRHMTYEQIGDLYLSQWWNLNGCGKSPEFRTVPRAGETLKQAADRVRNLLRPEPLTVREAPDE